MLFDRRSFGGRLGFLCRGRFGSINGEVFLCRFIGGTDRVAQPLVGDFGRELGRVFGKLWRCTDAAKQRRGRISLIFSDDQACLTLSCADGDGGALGGLDATLKEGKIVIRFGAKAACGFFVDAANVKGRVHRKQEAITRKSACMERISIGRESVQSEPPVRIAPCSDRSGTVGGFGDHDGSKHRRSISALDFAFDGSVVLFVVWVWIKATDRGHIIGVRGGEALLDPCVKKHGGEFFGVGQVDDVGVSDAKGMTDLVDQQALEASGFGEASRVDQHKGVNDLASKRAGESALLVLFDDRDADPQNIFGVQPETFEDLSVVLKEDIGPLVIDAA